MDEYLPVSVTDWEHAIKPGDQAVVVARFATVAEAENYIDDQHAENPDKVERGDLMICDEDEAGPCCYGYVTSQHRDHEVDCPEYVR